LIYPKSLLLLNSLQLINVVDIELVGGRFAFLKATDFLNLNQTDCNLGSAKRTSSLLSSISVVYPFVHAWFVEGMIWAAGETRHLLAN
jgi:hypothetical protein